MSRMPALDRAPTAEECRCLPRRVPLALALIALLGAHAGGCSGDDQGPSIASLPDSTTFEVTWRPATVVIDEAGAKEQLLASDALSGQFVFGAGATEVAALQPQDVVVLAGLGLFHVEAVTVESNQVVFQGTPAALTDAIADGTIAWDHGFDFQRPERFEAIQIVPKADASFVDGKLTYSGKIAGFDVSFTLTPHGDGVDIELSAKYSLGGAVTNVAGKGYLRGFRSEGNVEIRGSSLTDFSYVNRGLEGWMELEFGGVELGKGMQLISIPAKVTYPLLLGPIPAWVGIGGSLEVTSTLTYQSSALAKARLAFKGTAGLEVKNGSVNTLGALDSYELKYISSEHISRVDSGLAARFSFPRIELGVGLPGTGASLYFSILNEIVTNMTLQFEAAGPVPVITGSCHEVNVNLGGFIGQEVKVFNIPLVAEEQQVFGKLLEPPYQKGDICEK